MADILEIVKRYGVFGAVAGVTFEIIFWILGMIKLNIAVGIPLSTVAVERAGTAAQVGKTILAPLIAGLPQINVFNSFIMAALFGAVFVVLGGLVYELALKGILPAKTKTMKIIYVLILAAVAGGMIVARGLKFPDLSGFVYIVVGAVATAWILSMIKPVAQYIP